MVFRDQYAFSVDLKKSDVKDWDSMRHALLMFSIEEEFGIRFNDSAMTSVNSISTLINEINRLNEKE